jgi:hypothetical protein
MLRALVQNGGATVGVHHVGVQACAAGFIFGIENDRVRIRVHVDGVQVHRIQLGEGRTERRERVFSDQDPRQCYKNRRPPTLIIWASVTTNGLKYATCKAI